MSSLAVDVSGSAGLTDFLLHTFVDLTEPKRRTGRV